MRCTWTLTFALGSVAALLAAVGPSAVGVAQPTPDTAFQRGSALYTETCVSCHGPHGEGAAMPGLGIPRIDAGGSAWKLSDIDLTLLLRNGKGAMPGVGGTWSKQDLADVLMLVKRWWTPEQRRAHDGGPQTQAPQPQTP